MRLWTTHLRPTHLMWMVQRMLQAFPNLTGLTYVLRGWVMLSTCQTAVIVSASAVTRVTNLHYQRINLPTSSSRPKQGCQHSQMISVSYSTPPMSIENSVVFQADKKEQYRQHTLFSHPSSLSQPVSGSSPSPAWVDESEFESSFWSQADISYPGFWSAVKKTWLHQSNLSNYKARHQHVFYEKMSASAPLAILSE